jgi:hypothetical protein
MNTHYFSTYFEHILLSTDKSEAARLASAKNLIKTYTLLNNAQPPLTLYKQAIELAAGSGLLKLRLSECLASNLDVERAESKAKATEAKAARAANNDNLRAFIASVPGLGYDEEVILPNISIAKSATEIHITEHDEPIESGELETTEPAKAPPYTKNPLLARELKMLGLPDLLQNENLKSHFENYSKPFREALKTVAEYGKPSFDHRQYFNDTSNAELKAKYIEDIAKAKAATMLVNYSTVLIDDRKHADESYSNTAQMKKAIPAIEYIVESYNREWREMHPASSDYLKVAPTAGHYQFLKQAPFGYAPSHLMPLKSSELYKTTHTIKPKDVMAIPVKSAAELMTEVLSILK